jgi:KRAB domain-containing zinc finger protein
MCFRYSGEKPHVCKLCNKAFAQLPHLKKHMLCVHSTDKPYYCEVCQGFFKVQTI